MAEIDPVTAMVWEEIVRELPPERAEKGCLAGGRAFFGYLKGKDGPSFPLKEFKPGGAGKAEGGAGLLVGWRLLENPGVASRLERIFSVLGGSGEARLYGFYSQPSPDDILLWERRMRRQREGSTFKNPPGKKLSLGDVSGFLKTSPFERYLIRKNGIYYRAVLTKT